MGWPAVITKLDQLTESEVLRVDLRAQAIYRGLPPLLAWGDAGEATRNDFRRRAMSLMLFDGTLLYGIPPGGEDYGYAELQALDAEAAAVIRGELKAGEMFEPDPDAPRLKSGGDDGDVREGVSDDGN